MQIDLQIGHVLQALGANGLAQNTIVIFTMADSLSDTWPFTGRKTELLEGGLRVRAIIRWPDQIPCGIVSEQVAIGMDWFPTLLAAADAEWNRWNVTMLPPDPESFTGAHLADHFGMKASQGRTKAEQPAHKERAGETTGSPEVLCSLSIVRGP